MSRRLSREVAIQALYQQDVHPEAEKMMLHELEQQLQSEDLTFQRKLVCGVQEKEAELDGFIEHYLKAGWKLSRLSAVERAILRLATYELLFEKKTPQGVILSEAVELSKAFCGIETSRFINGILGKLVKDIDRYQVENKD